jgi:cyclopropane fatty-acyl-phospholipid synthase-like methyltransferase
MIVGAIQSGLALRPDDSLLDLCCGNGALTTQLFAGRGAGELGVDYSRFLIDIATARFVRRPTERYVLADALAYLMTETDPEQFTNVVCYGALPYFGNEAAARLLTTFHGRFTRVTRIFLGQLSNKARIKAFYANRAPKPGEQDDPGVLLGIWRTARELADFAAQTSWTAGCKHMPESFYASHHRFDAILTRS